MNYFREHIIEKIRNLIVRIYNLDRNDAIDYIAKLLKYNLFTCLIYQNVKAQKNNDSN